MRRRATLLGPSVADFVRRELADKAGKSGWRGLLVAISASRAEGRIVRSRVASIGLDVDIWLTAMPAHRYSDAEREATPAPSMVSAAP